MKIARKILGVILVVTGITIISMITLCITEIINDIKGYLYNTNDHSFLHIFGQTSAALSIFILGAFLLRYGKNILQHQKHKCDHYDDILDDNL